FIHDAWAGLLEAPQINGDAGKLQTMIGHVLLEALPVGPGGMGDRSRMDAECPQFDAVVTQIGELVDDLVEIVGSSGLIEDVRPATDGEFAYHGINSWCLLAWRVRSSSSVGGLWTGSGCSRISAHNLPRHSFANSSASFSWANFKRSDFAFASTICK